MLCSAVVYCVLLCCVTGSYSPRGPWCCVELLCSVVLQTSTHLRACSGVLCSIVLCCIVLQTLSPLRARGVVWDCVVLCCLCSCL